MSHKVDKSAKVISQMFTSLAPRYDLMNDLMTGFTHRWTRKFALELLGNEKIERALDLASGTGDFVFLLQTLMKSDSLIIGCDFSKGMLEIAHHRSKTIRSKNEAKNLAFFNSDISHLPFSDETFDVCSIIYGLRNVADPQAVLQELNRVTTKRGQLIIVESFVPNNLIIRFLYSSYFKNIVPIISSLFSTNVHAYNYYIQSVEQFMNPEEVLKLLKHTQWKQATIYSLLLGSVVIYQILK